MGYQHIDRLDQNQDILLFKKAYATEKIHGTSAHIGRGEQGKFVCFSGGAKHEAFGPLFDGEAILKKINELVPSLQDVLDAGKITPVIVYGEAYGGKLQGMSDTYGKELRFVAFEVKIGHSWLSVDHADGFARQLGLDFVPYEVIEVTREELERVRDMPSRQAVKCGITDPRPREGVVLRPLQELRKNNNERIICKFKGQEFDERNRPQKDPFVKEKSKEDAEAIANDWVNSMRLLHVLQAWPDLFPQPYKLEYIPKVIGRMQEDVYREAKDSVVRTKQSDSAIARRTATLYKANILQLNVHADG